MLAQLCMGVPTINKLVKMVLLLLSYAIVLIGVYSFTDIPQGSSIKYALLLVALTTIYSYLFSVIDKDTFRIKFGWIGIISYVIGVAGFVLCSGLNQNSVAAFLSSVISTALLFTGVVKLNG